MYNSAESIFITLTQLQKPLEETLLNWQFTNSNPDLSIADQINQHAYIKARYDLVKHLLEGELTAPTESTESP